MAHYKMTVVRIDIQGQGAAYRSQEVGPRSCMRVDVLFSHSMYGRGPEDYSTTSRTD